MDINLLQSRLIARQAELKASESGTAHSVPNNEDLKEVAKEMESVFALQLIKVMRETSKSFSTEKEGMGQDTYMSMFDMELSKLFAERGMGLQDMLVHQLGRMADYQDKE